MTDCYTCRVLRSQIEQARANKDMAAAARISQEMATHYTNYHQPREMQDHPEIQGSEKLFGVTVRLGK